MSISENIILKAKGMKKQLTAVYYAYQDKRIKALPKVIIGIAILYALSPIDLIPDFIPFIGYLDDLIIIPTLIHLAIRLIPKEIMDEAKIKAEEKPFLLKKNWTFAIIFIGIWLVILYMIISTIITIVNK